MQIHDCKIIIEIRPIYSFQFIKDCFLAVVAPKDIYIIFSFSKCTE